MPMRRVNFDLDVLRSFVVGVDLGSFARAADRLGRSTSAVSAQLKKLEEQAGVPVLRRNGRGMALTESGETLLGYARRLLDLNDEAASAIQGQPLEGRVRLGLQEDFGEWLLPDVLGHFIRAHPKLRIEVRIARNSALMDGVGGGELDLALAWTTEARRLPVGRIDAVPMRWIGPGAGLPAFAFDMADPLPLIVLESPCLMRTAAIEALDRAGIPWRIAFTSASLAGLWAAVKAGLGVSVRTPLGLPASVRALEPGEGGLPALPTLGLGVFHAAAAATPAVERLSALILERLAEPGPVQAA